MSSLSVSPPRRWLASLLLLGGVASTGALLAAFKYESNRDAEAASANQPEPVELVTLASVEEREHVPTTTAIGTVRALRSIVLENEEAGTVRRVSLRPGQIVEPGALLVALDVSVEQAELRALEARAKLADTTLERSERLLESGSIAREPVDQARAERDVAQAQAARVRAIIARKTIVAPFRARVGLTDIHPGQYLNQGTELTTLQGLSDAVHVDFAVTQSVAQAIGMGSSVEIRTEDGKQPLSARIVAIDARVDPSTRNKTLRARLEGGSNAPSPGASVRVFVPAGKAGRALAIPVSALRKGPDGDHVWVVADEAGILRARERLVTSGPALGETVLVLGGLSAGERVAAAGSFKLRDGVRVQPATTLAAADR
jgi:membrane fusion protein (multidrug efflux system)